MDFHIGGPCLRHFRQAIEQVGAILLFRVKEGITRRISGRVAMTTRNVRPFLTPPCYAIACDSLISWLAERLKMVCNEQPNSRRWGSAAGGQALPISGEPQLRIAWKIQMARSNRPSGIRHREAMARISDRFFAGSRSWYTTSLIADILMGPLANSYSDFASTKVQGTGFQLLLREICGRSSTELCLQAIMPSRQIGFASPQNFSQSHRIDLGINRGCFFPGAISANPI